MYTNFFGLSDIPFSIAPNPDYLFMSDRHREALAHLTHGLGDTGGFVLLTGEVGTGKTTISRCLLEQLPDNTQVAFILNPTLSCLELLATICDELKVRYKKTGATLKYLTDKIQEKLLANQKNDVNTILIIDEAQHLQPEVLEQLRLLTNLETNTKKLLQVILIGQPELQQLLQRRDLRQLAQRITARYHLLPLTPFEVSQYISHRLSVADCHRSLFNKSAIKTIHKVSSGIPRIINLLCDRALTLAFGDNQSVVGRTTVIQAAEQALGPEYQYQPWWTNSMLKMSLLLSLLVGIGIGSYWLGQDSNDSALSNMSVKNSTVTQNTLEQAQHVNNSEIELSQPKPLEADNLEHIVKPNSASTENNKIDESVTAEHSLTESLTNKELRASLKQELMLELKEELKVELTAKSKNNLNEELEQQAIVNQGIVNQALADDEKQHIISGQAEEPVQFDLSKVEGISPSLLARLQSAVDESNDEAILNAENEIKGDGLSEKDKYSQVTKLMDMPGRFQDSVPSLVFDIHNYVSNGESSVKVNGRERYEGDNVASGVTLVQVLPQQVILSYQGEVFSLPMLTDW